MDLVSLQNANSILQNCADGPCLEMTVLGPEILFTGSGTFALTGGDLSPQLDGKVVPMYTPIEFKNGQILSFGRCKSGCRSYLSVRGEWLTPKWLGSYSAVPFAKPSEVLPSVLQKEDRIRIEEKLSYADLVVETPIAFNNDPIPLFQGPEMNLFTSDSIADLLGKRHQISPQSNRMGYRLEGVLKDYVALPELISSGIVPGTVQVTTSGQLIVLMADAQTTGGYHRIGVVSRDGINRLAQMKPGDGFYFTLEKL